MICANCRKETVKEDMKITMKANREYYVCSFFCMIDFYKPKEKEEETVTVKTARIDEIISDVKREFYYINDEGEENEAALSIIQKLEEIKKKG